MEGKIIFTPKDYDNLRAKMNGLSYFNEEDYSFSKNLVNEETKFIAEQIEENNRITKVKREKINEIIAKSLSELGLELKTKIDGDFDFMMKLDRSILSDAKKLNELKKTILKNLVKEYSNEITDSGDFRLKQVKLDDGNIVDIDITFTNKTDKVLYSTDMALVDRLETIKRNDVNKKLNKYSKKAIKTFLNFENYIINSFDYELSNGIVEGTNNLIKQVKHNACGYRKFTHLKARIMLIKGIYNPLNA